MRKIVCIAFSLACALTSVAQNAKEIVSRMEETFDARQQEGVSFNSKWSVTIVNSRTTRLRVNMLGQYSVETEQEIAGDMDFITSSISMLADKTCEVFPDKTMYDDGQTVWKLSADNNEVNSYNKATYGYLSPRYTDYLSNIRKDYRLSILDETDDHWVIACKCKTLSKLLADGRDMELTVSKATYEPEMLVIRDKDYYITLSDFHYGVTEDQVTFHPTHYLASER